MKLETQPDHLRCDVLVICGGGTGISAAVTARRAVIEARRLGYRVVAKLHSHTVTHKSDAGGIKLDLRNADEVIDAFLAIESSIKAYDSKAHFGGVKIQQMARGKGYEVILGSTQDEGFGSVLLFGMGVS